MEECVTRRYLPYVLVFCASVTALAQAPAGSSNSRPEDQVAQLERDWLAADGRGDADRLRQVIADDFIGGAPRWQLAQQGRHHPRKRTAWRFCRCNSG